jgi:hypothetical protein
VCAANASETAKHCEIRGCRCEAVTRTEVGPQISGEITQQALRHLAANSIAGTHEEDAPFHVVQRKAGPLQIRNRRKSCRNPELSITKFEAFASSLIDAAQVALVSV